MHGKVVVFTLNVNFEIRLSEKPTQNLAYFVKQIQKYKKNWFYFNLIKVDPVVGFVVALDLHNKSKILSARREKRPRALPILSLKVCKTNTRTVLIRLTRLRA